jgi:hypothetical protein
MVVQNLPSAFSGDDIEALPIPGRWLRGEALPDEPVKAEGQQVRIGTRDYIYDRLGIRLLVSRIAL